jgi:hypothetical protein
MSAIFVWLSRHTSTDYFCYCVCVPSVQHSSHYFFVLFCFSFYNDNTLSLETTEWDSGAIVPTSHSSNVIFPLRVTMTAQDIQWPAAAATAVETYVTL